MKNTIISHSELDTMKLAKNIASQIKIGDIIILTGDLGAGKTKFTEGFLSYFDLQDEISSPTFTIVNEYQTPKFPLYHFDVYRLSDVSEFYEIGGEEYFSKGVCLIEWGEQILEALPNNYLHISFSRGNDENERILSLETIGNFSLSLKELL